MTGDDAGASCPVAFADRDEIELAHGGGGSLTRALIEQLFLPAFASAELNARHDGAQLDIDGVRLAFTTDSYVVRPHFFRGGDIGALAVNGTVNDLAMCGARPLYLGVAVLLEEGFAITDLQRVVDSMRAAAHAAGVRLVTGDTKVVDRGHGDGIYVNTSGIGVVGGNARISPASIRPGDALVLSGDIGRHGMAVMSAREGLQFEPPIASDTAPLAGPVMSLLAAGIDVHCLRDPTRGGLATTLVELADTAGVEIGIDEQLVPVPEDVRAACEILGLDPLYVANEGRFVAFVPEAERERTLEVLRADPLCRGACVIGTVARKGRGLVTARTAIGGQRVLDLLSGEQLPRIC